MRIVTDSGADLTPEDLTETGVIVAPLMIQFPEGEQASNDMTPDDFYNRLVAMQPEIPTTAQPSGGMLWQIYEGAANAGEDVLAIHISSGLSGTASTAQGAAERTEGGRVTIFDSLTLSGGQRFQVLTAVKALQAGWSLERVERSAQFTVAEMKDKLSLKAKGQCSCKDSDILCKTMCGTLLGPDAKDTTPDAPRVRYAGKRIKGKMQD